jgi:hypothetical protein
MKNKISPLKGKTIEEIHGDEKAKELTNFFSHFNKDRDWFVNPETNHCIHILKTEMPPDGYVRGRSKFKKIKTPKSYSASKNWIIIEPNDNRIQINNLAKFCRDNNLNTNCMRAVAYNTRKHHKNYRCELG